MSVFEFKILGQMEDFARILFPPFDIFLWELLKFQIFQRQPLALDDLPQHISNRTSTLYGGWKSSFVIYILTSFS